MAIIRQELTEGIIGAAIEVHRNLGPGLMESAYRRCMVRELEVRGMKTATEMVLDLEYKGLQIVGAYRLDLMVNDAVVVELKAVTHVDPVYRAQLLTYLRITGAKIGLLINFNVTRLRDGLTRVVL